MTAQMLRAAREVAAKHDVPVCAVIALASAMGPACWRGCVDVTVWDAPRVRPSKRVRVGDVSLV